MFSSLDKTLKQINKQYSVLHNKTRNFEARLDFIDKDYSNQIKEMERLDQTIETQDIGIQSVKTYCICISLLLTFVVFSVFSHFKQCTNIKQMFTGSQPSLNINRDSNSISSKYDEEEVRINRSKTNQAKISKLIMSPIIKTTKNVDTGISGFTEEISKKKKKKKVKFMDLIEERTQ